jgi:hypothetical protein
VATQQIIENNTMSTPSKQQLAFYRKLYLAHLIDRGRHNIPSLEEETGMPRRTLQDAIKALSDLDIECRFVEQPGQRHNSGYFVIDNWGPINADWVERQESRLKTVLGS